MWLQDIIRKWKVDIKRADTRCQRHGRYVYAVYDTVRSYISILLRSMREKERLLLAFCPPCFRGGFSHATWSTLETKIIWYPLVACTLWSFVKSFTLYLLLETRRRLVVKSFFHSRDQFSQYQHPTDYWVSLNKWWIDPIDLFLSKKSIFVMRHSSMSDNNWILHFVSKAYDTHYWNWHKTCLATKVLYCI